LPFLLAFLCIAGVAFADLPITGAIHGNSVSYTVGVGASNAGSSYLVTGTNTTTNQAVAASHTATDSGQLIGNVHFPGGIQGGDTIVLTVYQVGSTGLWEPIGSASFTKPVPPLVVRWAKALQRAVKELIG
jgi:hypothetical protein